MKLTYGPVVGNNKNSVFYESPRYSKPVQIDKYYCPGLATKLKMGGEKTGEL